MTKKNSSRIGYGNIIIFSIISLMWLYIAVSDFVCHRYEAGVLTTIILLYNLMLVADQFFYKRMSDLAQKSIDGWGNTIQAWKESEEQRKPPPVAIKISKN